MKQPKFPKKVTVESVREYKSAMRLWDRWRIENKIKTPQEIQRENSIFPDNVKIKVVRFPWL